MTIETRFNKGQEVFIILNNEIKTFPVDSIQYVNDCITYVFKTSRSMSLMDKDKFEFRDEEDVFLSIDEIATTYKKRLNKN